MSSNLLGHNIQTWKFKQNISAFTHKKITEKKTVSLVSGQQALDKSSEPQWPGLVCTVTFAIVNVQVSGQSHPLAQVVALHPKRDVPPLHVHVEVVMREVHEPRSAIYDLDLHSDTSGSEHPDADAESKVIRVQDHGGTLAPNGFWNN